MWQEFIGYKQSDLIAERFEVVRLLGQGANGAVFMVKDHLLRKEVLALKLLYPHLVLERKTAERFRNEVLLSRRLSHPNIVRVFEFIEAPGPSFYLSMELVEGRSLKEVLSLRSTTGLPFQEAIDVLYNLASGLAHAHAQGIIHRDIKPQNILVDNDGTVKISDFGLARCLEWDQGFTKTGESLGTPYYMAPEQFRGEKASERSDVYSFGILAYELFMGQPPFEGDVFLKLAESHMQQPLPQLRDDVPEWCKDLVLRCAAKKPEERVADMQEVVETLFPHVAVDNDARQVSVRRLANTSNAYLRKLDKVMHRKQRLRLLFAVFLALLAVVGTVRFETSIYYRVGTPILRWEKYFQENDMHLATLLIVRPLKRIFDYQVRVDQPEELFRLLKTEYELLPVTEFGDKIAMELFEFFGSPDRMVNRRERRSQVIAVMLLRAGANLEVRDSDGNTPLLLSSGTGNNRITQELIESKADVNARNKRGVTPLQRTVSVGDNITLSRLLKHGANPNVKDAFGNTPIHAVVFARRIDMLSSLLGHSPERDVQNSEGKTALHLVAEENSPHRDKMAELLLKSPDSEEYNGADPNIRDGSGRTPLMLAVLRENVSVLSWLLKSKRLKLDVVDARGRTVIDYLEFSENEEIKTMMLKYLGSQT